MNSEERPFMAEGSTLTLCPVPGYGALCLFSAAGWSKVLICEYSETPLGVILFLNSFSRTVVFDFPRAVQSQVLGHPGSTGYGCQLME